MDNATASPLTINTETGRWEIGDRELHAGDCFQLQLEQLERPCDSRTSADHPRIWIWVRFEWAHGRGGPTGYCVLALAGHIDATIRVPEGAIARIRP